MIKNNPRVSVIIPNYNHAVYLKQRIESVLNQTFQDLEIILLDDCSTDESKEIIEGFRSNNKISHIIYNEVNSGNTFKQWNKGIQLAGGDYVWIAESDDWCEITLLENLVCGIEKNINCVIAYCQSYCVSNDGVIKFQSNHTKLEEYINGDEFIKKYILPRNPIFNAGMAIWKRNIYNSISKGYQQYKLIGDYYFWIELCRFGDVYVSGKLLNYFRSHNKNVSINSINNGFTFTEQIPLLKHLYDEGVIDKSDYILSLKRSYSLFKSSKKSISKEKNKAIKKLFSSYSKARYKLEFYFFQKLLQSSLRKILRA